MKHIFIAASIIMLSSIFHGCTEEVADEIEVESFAFAEPYISLGIDESVELEYTCVPEIAASAITWEVANTDDGFITTNEVVVSIEGNTVTGLSRGHVSISAYINGVYYGSVDVLVDMLLEEGDIVFDPDPLVLEVGETRQVSYHLKKPYYSGEFYIDNDNNSFILTNGESGFEFSPFWAENTLYVYGQKAGSGYFALEFSQPFSDIPFCDTLFITVSPVKLKGIVFSSKEYDVEETDVIHNPIVFTPENATNKNVSFSIENPDIAEINGSGDIVAKNVGSTRIKATSEDGSHTAECEVTVGYKGIYIRTIGNKGECLAGEKVLLYSYNKANDEPYLGAFWYSDDSHATVAGDGDMTNSAVFQAYQPGYCTVYARMREDISKIASYRIHVRDITDFLKLTGGSEVHEWSNNKMSLTYSGEIENSSSQDVKLVSVAAMSDDLSTIYYLKHYNTYLSAESSYALEPFYVETDNGLAVVITIEWNGEERQMMETIMTVS